MSFKEKRKEKIVFYKMHKQNNVMYKRFLLFKKIINNKKKF